MVARALLAVPLVGRLLRALAGAPCAGGYRREWPLRRAGDIDEALDLLGLWFSRFQGYTAGTPENMVVRTTTLLSAYGREPRRSVTQDRAEAIRDHLLDEARHAAAGS
jgi:hypothetical protein